MAVRVWDTRTCGSYLKRRWMLLLGPPSFIYNIRPQPMEGLVQPVVGGLGSSHLDAQLNSKILHRHTRMHALARSQVSMVTLNPIKMTINTNHHIITKVAIRVKADDNAPETGMGCSLRIRKLCGRYKKCLLLAGMNVISWHPWWSRQWPPCPRHVSIDR